MKKPALFTIITSAIIVFAVIGLNAQTNNQPLQDDDLPAQVNRPKLVRELDLSPEQVRQLRQISREYQPPLRDARQKMQAANQLLDDAIYSKQSDAVIQSRLRAAQNARTDFLKARTDSESAIARILKPNQLMRFRELRRQNRQPNARNRQLNNQTRPNQRRLNSLPRRILNNRRQPRRNNF